MARLRLPAVMVAAVALLLLRADHVIGQPVEDCLLEPEATVPLPVEVDVPTCEELVAGIAGTPATAPKVPAPPGAPVPGPGAAAGAPPVSPRGGCVAVDPGTQTCEFTATGWIEVDVLAVVAHVEIRRGGEAVGGFAGAGYDPPKLFGVVLPSASGDRVVVRADRGWVAARNRS